MNSDKLIELLQKACRLLKSTTEYEVVDWFKEKVDSISQNLTPSINETKRVILVPLEHFQSTSLDKELDSIYGEESQESLIYRDVVQTYLKHLWLHASENIIILTDKVPEQDHKFMDFLIKIRNVHVSN